MLPAVSTLATFALASVALYVTPGPDLLFIIARGVGQGRRAAVAARLGVGAGILVHTCAAAFGLAALLKAAPIAFLVVKYVGAGYLLWLGIRLLTAAQPALEAQRAVPAPLWTIFRQGAMSNLLNPKIALFFLAFLPQFVDPAAASTTVQMLLLGLLFCIGGTIFNAAVGCGFGLAGDWLARRPAIARLQQKLTGVVFIGLALRLAMPERR